MLTARNLKLRRNRPRPTATAHPRYPPVNPEDFYWDPRYHTDEGDPDLDFAARWTKPKCGNTIEFQILKGLQGKEKHFVLKLAESFEALIRDGRSTVVSTPLTAYQRFLVHCCSVYYGLAFGVLPSTHEIYNVRTPSSRIPQRRISDMTPPDLPARDLLPVTERHERYQEACARIFLGLEEKGTRPEIGDSDAISTPNSASAVAVEKDDIEGGDEKIPTHRAADEELTSQPRNVKDFEAVRHAAYESKAPISLAIEEKYSKTLEDGNSYSSSNHITPTTGVMNEGNGGGANKLDEDSSATLTASQASPADVDVVILGALESKDRIYVLKLEETFEAMIMESRTCVEVAAVTAYQRLLVHRCSAYYKLSPKTDTQDKVTVLSTPDSRIPARRLCNLVPAEPKSAPWPTFKGALIRSQLKIASQGSLSATNSSGSGSRYSKASSRTESTDYGTYYTRMALSQESLVEGSSRLWRDMSFQYFNERGF